MWRKSDLSKLKAAERAELRRQAKVERRARWRGRWARWVAFWKRRGRELSIAGGVVGALATLKPVLIPVARQVVRFGVWARAMYRAGDIGPPVLPPPTGIPSTAFDRVPEPKKPSTK